MSFATLVPDAVFASVLDIKKDWLADRGIKGLAVDLDNTLVPYGQPVPGLDIVRHGQDLVVGGFSMVIVSNAGPRRAALAAEALKLPYLAKAGKPRPRAFRQALDILNCEPRYAAVIGDQIFRDILGARRAGCLAVLVTPMSSRDFPGTKLLRWPESMLIRYLINQGRWPLSKSL
jgi:uncharacterized protein